MDKYALKENVYKKDNYVYFVQGVGNHENNGVLVQKHRVVIRSFLSVVSGEKYIDELYVENIKVNYKGDSIRVFDVKTNSLISKSALE